VTTAQTLALLEAVGKRPPVEVLAAPFGRPFGLGPLRLELYPSGHVPGAAQLVVTEPSGRRIAYAGDVNTQPSLGPPAEVRAADVLVLEAPLAPLGLLPPRASLLDRLVESVARGREAGRPVVVLAPPLGVAQEAARCLDRTGQALRAHPRIVAYSRACHAQGIAMPRMASFRDRLRADEVLLHPLDLRTSNTLQKLVNSGDKPAYCVALSPLGLEADAARRLGVDEVIPLCDHADRAGLVEHVRHSGAREVYLTAGYCEALVDALAAVGVATHPLGPPRQMELFVGARSRT